LAYRINRLPVRVCWNCADAPRLPGRYAPPMPLVLTATALKDLARGMRGLARQSREDAERQQGSEKRRALESAERSEKRAEALDKLAEQGGTFELRKR
jgi:hypothetical protein